MVVLRSQKDTESSEIHLVTGGGGYPGYNLAKKLSDSGYTVRLLDIREPIWTVPDNVHFIQGDIRNYEDVETAFKDVDCVYHLASYGMSGREQLNTKLIEEVNVTGTENVIKACCSCGVPRLVYTSTHNVIFGGLEIHNGDESLPYLPLQKHSDHYSRTKSIAEQRVLKANGSSLGGGGTLQTCALRLAGVYGPGELRHLPRIVSYLEVGLFAFTIGDSNSLVDFIHIDNLVHSHYLAGQALMDKNENVAAGQAYFVSDNKPVNNFEFFRPLVEGLGYDFPRIKLPVLLVYFFAYITELLHFVIGRFYDFQPMLTRTEVYKTGVTHYFSIEKARRELGYVPLVQNDLSKIIEHYRKLGRVRNHRGQSSLKYYVVNFILAMMFFGIVMSIIPIAV